MEGFLLGGNDSPEASSCSHWACWLLEFLPWGVLGLAGARMVRAGGWWQVSLAQRPGHPHRLSGQSGGVVPTPHPSRRVWIAL